MRSLSSTSRLFHKQEKYGGIIAIDQVLKISKKYIQDFITKNQVDQWDLQLILDEVSISNAGYNALYKPLHSKLKGSNIHASFLPNPTSLRHIRRVINEEVLHALGAPYYIEDVYNSSRGEVHFNPHNNIF